MAKFNEFSETDRIIYLKDEFVRTIEELLVDPNEVQKLSKTLDISEDKFKAAMAFIPSLKAAGCDCGTCLSMDKLEARVPPELECLISIARKRCEDRAY